MANIFVWTAFLGYAVLHQAHAQSCSDPTGKFDLTSTFQYPYVISGAGSSSYDYYYSPCITITCGTATPTDSNVCQEAKTGTVRYNAGKTAVWNVINSTYAIVTYSATTGTTNRVTTVTILKTSTGSRASTTQVVEGTAGKYSFTIYMPIGGSSSSSSSGDISGYVGFILISIIILAVIAYFVIGAVIMAKVKGAQGMEIIPNIAFWKDLPFLIKDGIMFVLSPCVGHRSSYTKM